MTRFNYSVKPREPIRWKMEGIIFNGNELMIVCKKCIVKTLGKLGLQIIINEL